MLDALYFFFFDLFYTQASGEAIESFLYDSEITLLGSSYNYNVAEYFSILCSFISLVIILVICCLFVYKIIRLIGGLIR